VLIGLTAFLYKYNVKIKFSPSSFALNGFFPGQFSTLAAAINGQIEFVVVIRGGRAGQTRQLRRSKNYTVTVNAIYDGRIYADTRTVNAFQAHVIAKMHGINTLSDNVMVSVNGIQITSDDEIEVVLTRVKSTVLTD
jgi:hypothetical protein